MAQASAAGNGHRPVPPIPTRAALEAAGIKIAVGIPMERSVQDAAFVHFWNVARRGWPLIDHLYGRTDVNRNKMARLLLETDFTHLFMMDLDHLHPADIVERHARWVLEDPTRLVVGGLHFRRGEPFEPCAFVFGPDNALHAPVEWEPGLAPVHALGHGTILIHRSVFERLGQPWWAYDYGSAEEGVYPSEDMYFSYLCREAGITLWCDTTTTSPHLITSVVDEGTFRGWLADHPERFLTVEEVPEDVLKSKDVQMPEIVTRVQA